LVAKMLSRITSC